MWVDVFLGEKKGCGVFQVFDLFSVSALAMPFME